MRKYMIIVLVFISITAASCNAKAVVEVENTPETPKQVQTEEKLNTGKMELAYEGKIDKLQAGVGDRLAKVIEELGEPLELANFEGASYISYQNFTFILDKVIEKTSDEAEIFGIVIAEGYEIYGVKVGMAPDEIKSILGAANQEYKDGEGDEEMWKLEYTCGDYSLTFFFNDNSSPSTSAYLSKL